MGVSNRCLGLGAAVVATVLAFPAMRTLAESTGTVTFSRNIAPILQTKCQSCHEPGSIAPMSLRTYQEVRPYARAIKARVAARQMPPWHIDRTIGAFLPRRSLCWSAAE